ncbi:MAG: TIGR03747 family integrating conjugative element membrane protein [Proteobacteria bacterium]|nr:TIGR03747 family integrating conjugative element membrane protein [Pseudomonadota bacterium]
MLKFEIALVESEFTRSLLVDEPAGFVLGARDRVQALLELTGAAGFVHWVASRPSGASRGWTAHLHRITHPVSHFLLAGLQVLQLFAVRLAVLALAIPAFMLFGVAGLIDGLVQRDLRRRSAGRESSFIYHHARAAIPPLLVAPFIVYLALPVSLHPGWVVLPAALLTSLAVALAARSFKKYL